MINFVLKKFIKKLNNVSLSADERAHMRGDFLTRTGLQALSEHPSLKHSFVLAPSKMQPQKRTDDQAHFELHLVEECPDGTEDCGQNKETKIQMIESCMILKVNLDVLDKNKIGKQSIIPKTFVLMKVVPSKRHFYEKKS